MSEMCNAPEVNTRIRDQFAEMVKAALMRYDSESRPGLLGRFQHFIDDVHRVGTWDRVSRVLQEVEKRGGHRSPGFDDDVMMAMMAMDPVELAGLLGSCLLLRSVR